MKINVKKVKKMLAEVLYLFIILFFCYATTNKLLNLNSFRTNLLKTSLFTEDIAKVFSVCVIIIETIIILLLIFYKKKGLLIFSITMLIFTLYISYLRFKGLYEVCGCGGILNGLDYKYHFLINLSFLFGSIYCYMIASTEKNEK